MLIFFDLYWILAFIVCMGMLLGAIALQQLTNLPIAWIFGLGTAAWATWDGLRIPLIKYRSPIAYGLIRLLISFFLMWPYGIAWYLVMKYKIAKGKAQVRENFGSENLSLIRRLI